MPNSEQVQTEGGNAWIAWAGARLPTSKLDPMVEKRPVGQLLVELLAAMTWQVAGVVSCAVASGAGLVHGWVGAWAVGRAVMTFLMHPLLPRS